MYLFLNVFIQSVGFIRPKIMLKKTAINILQTFDCDQVYALDQIRSVTIEQLRVMQNRLFGQLNYMFARGLNVDKVVL